MAFVINNLSKSFDTKLIYNNFSFNFPEKGVFTLSGESGCGKTTLLRIIAGLDLDYTGEVIGGGKNNVSFAFQEYRLFPHLNAIDNVVFSISDRKDEAVYNKSKNMLLSLGFSTDDLLLYPSEMSGGMKQRVSIARALAYDADLILMDEPFKGLDAQTRQSAIRTVLESIRGKTAILISHDPYELSLCDTVYSMSDSPVSSLSKVKTDSAKSE